jgi:hypothetical protein
MTSAEFCRRKTDALFKQAIETLDADEGLLHTFRALEFERMAQDLERGQGARRDADRTLHVRKAA